MPRRVEYIVSVKPTHSIRVHPWPKNQTSKADRTPKRTSDLATDGYGYTRMRSAGFLALDREKIGTKLYGYVLAKRYTIRASPCALCDHGECEFRAYRVWFRLHQGS